MHHACRRSTWLAMPALLYLVLAVDVVPAPARTGNDPRIARVENGLLPPVLFAGQQAWNIQERMKFYNIPGVSVAVFADHEIQWAKGYGVMDNETKAPVTENTLFLAGSISKPVAVMGALRLVQEGTLSLDTDINTFLTSWKVPGNAFTAEQPVTLRQIMSHTAGLTVQGFSGYAPGKPLPTLIQILAGDPPANSDPIVVEFVPGSRWRYSGGGLTVMQLALVDAGKQPFPEVLRETVLEPIGMTSSSFAQAMAPDRLQLAASGHHAGGELIEGARFIYPEMAAAGLWTTPSDLAKFALEIERSARGESNRVLAAELAGLMVSPQRTLTPDIDMALGLFLVRHGSTVYFTYDGEDEGFIASLLADRDGGYGVVIMTNSDGRSLALINEITMSVAKEYGWRGYVPAPYAVISLDAAALAPFAGRYRLDSDNTLTVRLEGGRLAGRQTGQPACELLPISPTGFIRTDAALTYTFADGQGTPSDAVTLTSDREPQIATRVADDFETPADWLEAGDTSRAIEGYRALWKQNPEDPNLAERRLDNIGIDLLSAGKTAAAIAFLKLNVALHPESWTAFHSLGEAYLKNGDRASAGRSYARSLALNPGDASGAKKLDRLKNGRR